MPHAPKCRPIALLILLFLLEQAAMALPPGFRKEAIVTGLEEPTNLVALPDGRLLVCERSGTVLLVEDYLATPVLDIPDTVTWFGEGGLLGVALHPDFSINGYVYFFTTTNVGGVQHSRVSRFTFTGAGFDTASLQVIWQTPVPEAPGHFAGGLGFSPDRLLFVSTGDNWSANDSQDVASPRGKLLRMTADGQPVDDNPFRGGPGAAPYVWAYGFRNPYRFSIDSVTGRIYVGDVGFETWEEINLVLSGENYGWPLMEGPACYIDDCSAFAAPSWYYEHGVAPYFGYAVTMGPVYRAGVFPPEYGGTVFVGDFAGGVIRRLLVTADGQVTGDADFDDEADFVVAMAIGPDGALYYNQIFDNGDSPAGVYRISYAGGANTAPVALASAEPATGPAPLTVTFRGDESFDPDAGPAPLTHRWFFGDGATSSEVNPTHEYAEGGLYEARLVVSDGAFETVSDPIQIRVGAPPVLTLKAPAPGLVYRCGDTIVFEAEALDKEDGSLPPAAFSWTFLTVRPPNSINVLDGPFEGVAAGSYVVPVEGRPLEESTIRVQVTATDSDGLEATASVDIPPVISPLNILSQPSEIPIFLNEYPYETPHLNLGPVNYLYTLKAQSEFELGGVNYRFVEWVGFAGPAIEFAAPEGGATFTAIYEPVAAGEAEEVPAESKPSQDDAGIPCFTALLPPLGALLWLTRRPR